ncbi:PLP-dependent aminotransferase family protein [Sphingobacterium phlebotomi]|uniref:PLP-dependent aminotransferase family protein n=1 Tax=Sphingobacterium phlebotomi TaxID=2605433 RepID=A0A5D4GTV1_9SPHI|nr:PLP-dependent aminotransferase family protein [Sphingobacterium phlebotomi]TYR31768.1 PLP-dependent aminotransferase family protein [Sphingobacterium phlebotomi]
MAVQTLPFGTLIAVDRQSAIPIFRQIANSLIKLIRKGKIKPGYQLPATRDMASMLKLNRTTIVAAYEEMQAQGWLEVIKRKGNFVAQHLPVTSPKSFEASTQERLLSLDQKIFYRQIAVPQPLTRQLKPYQMMINDGYPDARIAPLDLIVDRYKFLSGRTNVHNRLLADGSKGSNLLRTELAHFLSKTRALDITPEQVLITHGAQSAISIAASMILQPGSTVVVGDLNYPLADRLFEQQGAKLIKVKVDHNGIDIDEIENICKQSVPSLLYIVPHHHHPTTVTLSAERRNKLLDIIRRYRLPVIEDDYDYDFHYENAPILPLASAEHDNFVLYIGSISKTLSPTVRLGYLIGAEDFIWQASKLKQVLDIRGDVLFEESVGHLFNSGEMQRHLRRSVKLYKSRRDEFCEILNSSLGDHAKFNVPNGGMAVWTLFDPGYSIPQLSERLAAQGIYLNDGSIYKYKDDTNGMRLGFASLNTNEMQSFAHTLKKSR